MKLEGMTSAGLVKTDALVIGADACAEIEPRRLVADCTSPNVSRIWAVAVRFNEPGVPVKVIFPVVLKYPLSAATVPLSVIELAAAVLPVV